LRVAFVGKGGSGKSTLAGLFIQKLRSQDEEVLAVDADINQHLAKLIDADLNQDKGLSRSENSSDIKEYLTEENDRVKSPSHVYKTTPPAEGSKLINFNEDDYILSKYGERPDEGTFFLHVGTYEEEGIGTSCYHTDLAVFENILSHLSLEDEWLVTDMVAGTDAFSNTLHAQFDAIFLIVEPTPEGIEVYKQYRKLSKEAGMYENVYLVGNKVIDEEDREYLRENVEDEFLGFMEFSREIKKSRQRGKPVNPEILPENLFEKIREASEKSEMEDEKRLKRIHELHRKYAGQEYVVNAVGDITDQIDEEFSYE
jgi:CO dehydrogenase maturation factor